MEETPHQALQLMNVCINNCFEEGLCYRCQENAAKIYEERKTLRRKCQELLDDNVELIAKVRLYEEATQGLRWNIAQLTRKLNDAERLLSGMPSATPVLSGGEDSTGQDAPDT